MYNGDNRLTSSLKLDPEGMKVQSTEFVPGTKTKTSETSFNPVDGKPVRKDEFDRANGQLTRSTQYFPGTDKPHKVYEARTIKSCDSCPPETMDVAIEYKADGSRTENGYGIYSKFQAIYDKDGKEISNEGYW